MRPRPRGWPATLRSGTDPQVTLRPLRMSDVSAWRSARQRNAAWLVRWDATVPPGADPRATTFRSLVRRLRAAARNGTTYPFAVEVDGTFAGQLTINNIVRGSAPGGTVASHRTSQAALRCRAERQAAASDIRSGRSVTLGSVPELIRAGHPLVPGLNGRSPRPARPRGRGSVGAPRARPSPRPGSRAG